jgi:hypothetical protein
VPKTSAQLAYASPAFKALSDTVHELDTHRRSRSWGTFARTALRRRREIVAGAQLLRELPVVEVRLTSQPAGDAIRGRLCGRVAGMPTRRIARASLQLPAAPEDYLRGRSKQAVRTNLRHAETAGIACERVVDHDAQRARLTEFAELGGWELRHLTDVLGVAPGREHFHVARDAEGRTIAAATLDVDEHCAYLVFLQAVEGELTAPARYALTVHVIQELIRDGVPMLLMGNAVRLHPGLQYFQQRLGFEICNVRIADAEPAG